MRPTNINRNVYFKMLCDFYQVSRFQQKEGAERCCANISSQLELRGDAEVVLVTVCVLCAVDMSGSSRGGGEGVSLMSGFQLNP